jgi:hypothetical protein
LSKRITVYDLWSQKGKRKWAQTHIDTDKEAEAAFKAGIEIISCEPDHYFPKVRQVASGAFLSVGLKHGIVSSNKRQLKKVLKFWKWEVMLFIALIPLIGLKLWLKKVFLSQLM